LIPPSLQLIDPTKISNQGVKEQGYRVLESWFQRPIIVSFVITKYTAKRFATLNLGQDSESLSQNHSMFDRELCALVRLTHYLSQVELHAVSQPILRNATSISFLNAASKLHLQIVQRCLSDQENLTHGSG
jgi:hypothetical protein